MNEDAREMVTEVIPAILCLLPGWETLDWRHQEQLADSLHYLAATVREMAQRQNLHEMRLLHQRGEG